MKKLIAYWEKQEWLDKLAERVRPKIDSLLEATGNKQRAADILHGVWLGHPLHPMLVALPIGAWSTAAAFDTIAMLTGGKSKSATGAIAFGLLSALPTAAAGAADWRQTSSTKARLGAGHALMNSAGVASYGLSLLIRLLGGSGRLPAMLGLGFISASGYIGGHLAYSEQVGVRHVPDAAALDQFKPADDGAGIDDESLQRIEVGEAPILLARVDGQLYAVSDVCTHLGCSLAQGRLEGANIVCPCHTSSFSVVDGHVVSGPATMPLATYELRVQDGQIEVRDRVVPS